MASCHDHRAHDRDNAVFDVVVGGGGGDDDDGYDDDAAEDAEDADRRNALLVADDYVSTHTRNSDAYHYYLRMESCHDQRIDAPF